LISTLLSREGLRVATGHPSAFLKRLARVALPEGLREEVEPLVVLLQSLNGQIKLANRRLAELVERDDLVSRLCTVPGIGPVTATSFVATLDEHTRFAGAKETRAYLGLVPAEYSSGERRQLGHISKAGPSRMRRMLVESAWCILRRRNGRNAALHDWAAGVALRRGSRVASVALARKLAGILYAMWRDGTSFEGTAEGVELAAA
jgi:transposase